MAPAPIPAETEMPVDMPVSLPGDPVPPSAMSFSFSFSFDMEDDGEKPFRHSYFVPFRQTSGGLGRSLERSSPGGAVV